MTTARARNHAAASRQQQRQSQHGQATNNYNSAQTVAVATSLAIHNGNEGRRGNEEDEAEDEGG